MEAETPGIPPDTDPSGEPEPMEPDEGECDDEGKKDEPDAT